MHFGCYSDDLFQKIGVLKAFPYNQLKAKMSAMPADNVGLDRDAQLATAAFHTYLRGSLHKLDRHWSAAAARLLLLARVQHTLPKQMVDELAEHAGQLEEWAALSTEALRKIVEKYNKTHGGDLMVSLDNGHGIHFIRGQTRTQVQALAQVECSQCADDEDNASINCPICLETLFKPVAPECGHAFCQPCFARLLRDAPLHKGHPETNCPVCRKPARHATRLPVLEAIAKDHDPQLFLERSRAESQGSERVVTGRRLSWPCWRTNHAAENLPRQTGMWMTPHAWAF